jgi:hypothetical protein
MFDSQQQISERLTDAVDLVIDFATLGEYGLEPVDLPGAPCEVRRRQRPMRSSGAWNAAIAHFAAQP